MSTPSDRPRVVILTSHVYIFWNIPDTWNVSPGVRA